MWLLWLIWWPHRDKWQESLWSVTCIEEHRTQLPCQCRCQILRAQLHSWGKLESNSWPTTRTQPEHQDNSNQRGRLKKLSHSLSTQQSKTLIARAANYARDSSPSAIHRASPNFSKFGSLWIAPALGRRHERTRVIGVRQTGQARPRFCYLLVSLRYHRYPLTFLAWALLQGECKQWMWDCLRHRPRDWTWLAWTPVATLPDKQIMILSSCCGILVEKHRQIIHFRPTWKIAWTPCLLLDVKLSRICSTVCSIFWFVGRVMVASRRS